ncbi:uncharacterized protein MYCFIDRAFT_209924 [Pseudocercospora fijiensis CIRAD86]|uniref:Secreted protein n=1 Tax=Pseudocercospora fijiensis (strain CIRAD86) TaxID=383855 RepID=N1QC56_PSEFD|nr:uncharacterized protein MYCFIDRAFT_209924 [Pseudocercospora fijiensis CIRAD86]EME88888.1 hypothetical protein MYCFIDRAFT_209924 [Pseudocercospora fijiensis CIRAD86]
MDSEKGGSARRWCWWALHLHLYNGSTTWASKHPVCSNAGVSYTDCRFTASSSCTTWVFCPLTERHSARKLDRKALAATATAMMYVRTITRLYASTTAGSTSAEATCRMCVAPAPFTTSKHTVTME